MEPPSSRFRGFPFPEGLAVLDETTGEVVLVPMDGSPTRVLQPPRAAPLAPAAPPSMRRADVLAPVALDREALATFPYPIASVYRRFFDEADPRQKCRLLVDTFTTIMKLWALVLASEYLRTPTLRDAAVNDLLARDFQRPLISVWHLFIGRTLSIMRAEKHRMFVPELATAYEALETSCRTPFLFRTRYADAKGQARTRESKLGKIQALIKFRNSLAHGYNVPASRALEHLRTYLPVLRDILAEARFLARYPLRCGADQAGLAYRLMGDEPPAAPEQIDVACDARLFITSPQGGALPLDTLLELDVPEQMENVIAPLERELYLFEGNTKSAILYASPLGESVEKQSAAAPWKTLLAAKAIDAPLLRTNDISIEALVAGGRAVSDATIAALRSAGKFLSEATVRPPVARDLFSRFELGDYRGLVLAGDSGSGKTAWLGSWVEEHLRAGEVVLFYRASSLMDADLQTRVVRDLRLRDPFFEDFLSGVDAMFSESGRRMHVVIDGLNEFSGELAAIVGAVDAMVRQAAAYPWLRVVVSVRSSSYERLPKNVRFGRLDGTKYLLTAALTGERTPLATIPPLEHDELGAIYERYRELRLREPDDPPDAPGTHRFRPLTPFEAVERGRSTVAMMRNPLMLRLLLAAFHGRELPSELSYDDAMRLYFDQVIVAKDDPDGAQWERGGTLKAIVAELDRAGSESIVRDRLYDVPSLKRALQNAQKDSPYVQLLDLGVLTECWTGDTCEVRFAFDRLFEFLLAEQHEPRCADEYGILDLARRAIASAPLRGALIVILCRKCRRNELEPWRRALATCETLDAGAPEREMMVHVGVAMLEQLARTGADLGPALALLGRAEDETSLAVLSSAFDRILACGEAVAAESVARLALTRGLERGRAEIVERAHFDLGLVHQQRGDLDGALEAFARVQQLAGTDSTLAQRARIRQSDILRARGRTEDARIALTEVAAALEKQGALADASEARRQLAILARDAGRLDEALRESQAALELARTAEDVDAEAQALVSCGYIAWRRGDIGAATGWFERALPRADATGNVRIMASVVGSLAVLAREKGDLARAVRYGERQLALSERAMLKRSIASAFQNLGTFRFESGDVAGATTAWTRAAELLREIDVGYYAMTVVDLAMLDMHAGRLAEAKARLEAVRDEPRSKGESAELARWMLANIALDEGELESAKAVTDELRRRDGGPGSRARIAALEARLAIAHGNAADTPRMLASIVDSFRTQSPRAEVHELPIVALCEIAEATGLREAARMATELLAGRPHPAAERLAAAQLGVESA